MSEFVVEGKREQPDQAELRSMVASLYRQHSAYLIRLAPRFGCFPDCAEDLVHDTFLVAMQKAEALYKAENKKAWLILVLKRRIANFLRAIEYKRKLQMNLQALNYGAREDQIGLDALYSGLIGDNDLKLLIEFYVYRYPLCVLASRLDIKEAACKKRIQRARERMSAAYSAYIENRTEGNRRKTSASPYAESSAKEQTFA